MSTDRQDQQPWTPETVELAARALYDWTQEHGTPANPEGVSFYDRLPPASEAAFYARERATAVLTALAAADLLVDPSPDIRTLIANSSLGAGLEREIRAKVAAEIRAERDRLRPEWMRGLDGLTGMASSTAYENAARVAEGGDTDGQP